MNLIGKLFFAVRISQDFDQLSKDGEEFEERYIYNGKKNPSSAGVIIQGASTKDPKIKFVTCANKCKRIHFRLFVLHDVFAEF